MHRSQATLPVFLLIGLFLLGCSALQNPSVSLAPPTSGVVPGPETTHSTSLPPVEPEATAAAATDASFFELPPSPEVAPKGVLEQISWVGVGGDQKPNCDLWDGTKCVNGEGYIILLTDFTAHQQLRLEVYYPTGGHNEQTGEWEAAFLTEIVVETDEHGAFEMRVSQDVSDFVFIVLDMQGNVLGHTTGITTLYK